MKKFLLTLSLMMLLASIASAQATEMKLLSCYSDLNSLHKGKGNNFIANKNDNSLIEINLDTNTSKKYQLINFNSDYAEGIEIKRLYNSSGVQDTDALIIVEIYYPNKIVKIYNTRRSLYEGGKRIPDDQLKVQKVSDPWTYTCDSKSISK
jgi:hypothetical protein